MNHKINVDPLLCTQINTVLKSSQVSLSPMKANKAAILVGYHFLRKGSQIYKKVGVNKIATPLFRQQNFWPHHRYT